MRISDWSSDVCSSDLIKSETLFNGPQELGKVNNQLTVTSKDKTPERDARQAILKQLSDPLPPPGITHRAASTPEGAAYIGQLTAYSAKRSMASKPARDWAAITTASKETLHSHGSEARRGGKEGER